MEKRSAKEHRLLLVAAASLLCAALALACARPPLAARGVETGAPTGSFVVTTHPPRALPTQVVAHGAPDAQAEALDDSESEDPEPESYDAVFSDVEVERYEEKESGVSVGPMALYSALVLQRVASYEAWRSAFDAQLPARQKAGFVAQAVLRGAFDNKLVAVWLAVTDPALARGYLSGLSAPAKAAAKSGKPRTQLARNLASRLESAGVGLHAALITLELEDLPAFQAALDADAERRVALGIVGYALTQDLDDEAVVYLYLQSEDPARLKAYLASRETRRVWHEAGVVAQKSPTILREISLSSVR
jgi:quinol monooxygenase YgiN